MTQRGGRKEATTRAGSQMRRGKSKPAGTRGYDAWYLLTTTLSTRASFVHARVDTRVRKESRRAR